MTQPTISGFPILNTNLLTGKTKRSARSGDVNLEKPDQPRFERSEESGSESPDYSYEDDEPDSRAPVIISLIIGVVILVGGFLIYKYWYVPKAEKEKQERLAKEVEEKRKADEIRLAQEKAEEERKRLEAEAAAKAKPAEGTIETLTEQDTALFCRRNEQHR